MSYRTVFLSSGLVDPGVLVASTGYVVERPYRKYPTLLEAKC